MNFLADAHISVEMVAMIRSLGHDCLDASAIPPRMPDVDVLLMAASDQGVVIISDKDFGELVFVHKIPCPGVVLIRVALADEADRVAYGALRLAYRHAPVARLFHNDYNRWRPRQTNSISN